MDYIGGFGAFTVKESEVSPIALCYVCSKGYAGMMTVDDKKDIENTTNLDPGTGMDRLSAAFESSARRWELIVYPSLFAFIILAAYGFYLVYSLAKDVHYLAISVDHNMTVLSGNMGSVSENMGQLTANVRAMTVSLDAIDKKVGTLEPMLANMDSMDDGIQTMTDTTRSMTAVMNRLQYDMSRMNHNIGRPMSFMNAFMPW